MSPKKEGKSFCILTHFNIVYVSSFDAIKIYVIAYDDSDFNTKTTSVYVYSTNYNINLAIYQFRNGNIFYVHIHCAHFSLFYKHLMGLTRGNKRQLNIFLNTFHSSNENL
jgi:hypothetical protein